MTTVPTLQIVPQPIKNALIPAEGPKCIPINLDFTASTTYALSLQNLQSRDYVSIIQTIFIDNSSNADTMTVTTGVANQAIIAPPYTQGYYPVLCPQPPAFVFATQGGVVVPIQLINVPMPCAVWSVESGSGSTPIDTIVHSGYGYVLDNVMSENSVIVPRFFGSKNQQVNFSSSNNGTTLATASPYYFFTSFQVTTSSDIAFSNGKAGQVSVTDSAGNCYFVAWLNPGVANYVSLTGIQMITGTSGVTLYAQMSSSGDHITAGNLTLQIQGGQCAVSAP
jgi:hypothetical protein